MFLVNDEEITFDIFPDGTAGLSIVLNVLTPTKIDWYYDGDHECILLWHLVHHIREISSLGHRIDLLMPYVPNARMDRVGDVFDVFTLKSFAAFINAMNFNSVIILDPHSNVTPALIDRVTVHAPYEFIRDAITCICKEKGTENIVLCHPDEGSAKRYHGRFPKYRSVTCSKRRDWESGKILSLALNEPDAVKGQDILIIDDICSRGGTFMLAAQALKAAGANSVYLYVTHCEDTIFEGDVPESPLIDRVFTTPSIYHGKHPKITVLGGEKCDDQL